MLQKFPMILTYIEHWELVISKWISTIDALTAEEKPELITCISDVFLQSSKWTVVLAF